MSNNKSGDDAFGGFTANSYQKNWRRNKKKEGARGPVRKKKQPLVVEVCNGPLFSTNE